MELPPYRAPTLRGLLIHMWERGWLYLKKAGTVIFGISVILWALTSYPKKQIDDTAYQDQLARARADYLSSAGTLAEMLGPGVSEPVLAATLADGLATPAELSGSDDPALAGLIEMIATIQATRALELDRATSGQLLTGLRRVDPATYAAAVYYLDEVAAPLLVIRDELAQAHQAEALRYSLAGRIGSLLEPALRPMGFDWRIGTALIGAFAAKEIFVAQMGIVFSVGEADQESQPLRHTLRHSYSPLVGFCIMLFCLISTPCMATLAVTRRESGSWRWALLQLGALTALAWVLTVIVYQTGSLLMAVIG
jgi:ferrous iron transport protein B